MNCLNIEEVVYIDFPSIFEHDNYQNPIRLEKLPYHLRYLSRLLTHKKEIDVFDMEDNEDLNSISELIKDMLGGFIYFDDKKNEFMFIVHYLNFHGKKIFSTNFGNMTRNIL